MPAKGLKAEPVVRRAVRTMAIHGVPEFVRHRILDGAAVALPARVRSWAFSCHRRQSRHWRHDNIERHAGPDVPALLLAAPAPALRRLGQSRRAAAAAGAWRARPLPQLGLGRRRRCASDWHIIAPDLRGHGDSQWSPDGNYSMAAYIYDLAQLIHQQQPGAGHRSSPTRSAATSRCATPASTPRRAQAGGDRGAGPVAEDDGRARQQAHRRAHARLDRRAAQARRPPAAPLPDASRTPSSACRRRTRTSPPSRRGI